MREKKKKIKVIEKRYDSDTITFDYLRGGEKKKSCCKTHIIYICLTFRERK